MIFAEDKPIIFVHRQNIELYHGENSWQMPLAEDVVRDEEVVNATALSSLISQFCQESELKNQEAMMLLGSELIYEKDILATDAVKAQEEFELFISRVPFSDNQIGKIKIFQKDLIHVLATNANFYSQIKDSFEKNGWKITTIMPAAIFGLSGAQPISKDQLKEVGDKVGAFKNYNFLNKGAEINIPPKQTPLAPANQNNNKVWFLISGIIFMIGLIIIAVIFLINPSSQQKPAATVPATVNSNSVSSSESASQATLSLSKADVMIQVLNASGVAGQAAKIKEQLSKIGFKNITTENYPGKGKTGTLVTYQTKIPENIRSEIISELNKSIASVSAEATISAKFDVVIIVGK